MSNLPTLTGMQEQLNAQAQEAASVGQAITDLEVRLTNLKRQHVALVGTPKEENVEPQPLRHHVAKVLAEANEPLTVAQIAELVKENGYKTTATEANFKNIVQHVLSQSDDVRRIGKAKPCRYTVE